MTAPATPNRANRCQHLHVGSPIVPDWSDLGRQLLQLDLFAEVILPVGAPTRASELVIERCPTGHARALVARWHSRLPVTQKGPWKYAFRAHWHGYTYAVALWNNPSARTLPKDWLELRRLAVAPDAPHCTASRTLGQMTRWIRANTNADRLISYQDDEVHTGTIYAAAGWKRAHYTAPRQRKREGYVRFGTSREYRTAINGLEPDKAGKWRWEFEL